LSEPTLQLPADSSFICFAMRKASRTHLREKEAAITSFQRLVKSRGVGTKAGAYRLRVTWEGWATPSNIPISKVVVENGALPAPLVAWVTKQIGAEPDAAKQRDMLAWWHNVHFST
jgi:hypothetical protein